MQKTKKLKRIFCLFSLLLFFFIALPTANAVDKKEHILKEGDLVAIAGDSITGQRLYSKFIEAYLLACSPETGTRVANIGFPGEEASGFCQRIKTQLLPLNADVLTLCYGMNDGHYGKFRPFIAEKYDKSISTIVSTSLKKGMRVILATPPCVDTDTFRKWNKRRIPAGIYNETLRKLGEIDKKIATKYSVRIADVHSVITETMKKAKVAYGPSYHVAGKDGIHPRPNGHLVIAYAILKAMGFNGNIGKITVDFNKNPETEGPHEIISSAKGQVKVKSSRYPFCFYGKAKSPEGTVSILPFVPFNSNLNRFILVVKNCPAEKAEVVWGENKKVFSRKKLEEGVNLASEFMKNPFSANFMKLLNAIEKQQFFETSMTAVMIQFFKNAKKDSEIMTMAKNTRRAVSKQRLKLQDNATACVVPVIHTLKIYPIK